MKYRDVATLLRKAGFTVKTIKGSHEKWRNGPVSIIVPRHKIISKGVVRQVLKAIDRSRND